MNYSDGFIVRLRGLPWSVGKEEVASFLADCNVSDVHFTFTRDGRPSGEAYVELSSEDDVQTALGKNQQHMGKRYIEVFRSKQSEMEWVLRKDGTNGGQSSANSDSVVRLRGLPFSCTHDDIVNFFKGMQIVPNGIALLADDMGRASGEAYVQFASQTIADQALQKHKEKMGIRYVEIFKSSMMEAETAIMNQGRYVPGMGPGGRGGGPRTSPYDRTGGMRGAGMRGGGRGGAGAVGGGMRGRGAGNIKGLMMSHSDGDYGAYGSYGGGYGGDGYGAGGMNSGSMGLSYGAYGGTPHGGRGGMQGGPGMGGGRGRGGYGGIGGGAKMNLFESSTGHSVHMRGLPYSATDADVMAFFSPLNPMAIVFGYNDDGRPSGEADVDFATHLDAEQAMKKHKALMDRRYIELFLNSMPDAGMDSYGGLGGTLTGNIGSGLTAGLGAGFSSFEGSSFGGGSGLGGYSGY